MNDTAKREIGIGGLLGTLQIGQMQYDFGEIHDVLHVVWCLVPLRSDALQSQWARLVVEFRRHERRFAVAMPRCAESASAGFRVKRHLTRHVADSLTRIKEQYD
ncbi:hypothetical protein BISU_1331 [Bifidobacterium subtile]|jgi:hypothetical protein|uniref:Uncharacterized protein n=1 Tax=Bifidobacterium subtile TaxID=77635 RepID=A0A087EBR2_9BIFI|nr:hypothetical protein BISU_1331 [Bifidobacterium subtile]